MRKFLAISPSSNFAKNSKRGKCAQTKRNVENNLYNRNEGLLKSMVCKAKIHEILFKHIHGAQRQTRQINMNLFEQNHEMLSGTNKPFRFEHSTWSQDLRCDELNSM